MTSGAPTPAIRLRHVTHRFGDALAVDDLTLDVPKGEIFGFIGPNGAGKTTTIRIMATLLEPSSGRVEIDGIDAVVDPMAVRRRVGYMPDHAGVYDRITVREYLEFFAQAAGVEGAASIDAAIELTGLGDAEGRLVAALSKGMRQRLGLSRVLLHDPSVLVLDEPASDLDPRARIDMRDLLIELRALGKTIFLSSHILSELEEVCTSVGILEKGRLLVAGPMEGFGTAAARHRVKVRILGETADVLDGVRQRPGVLSATGGAGGVILVEHALDDQFVAELVRWLVLAGTAVVGVEKERAPLERVFLDVTKGRGA